MKIRPFSEGDAYGTFKNLLDITVAEIDALDNEYVLKASPTELESFLLEKVMIEPLELQTDQYEIVRRAATQIDVTGDIRHGIFPGEWAIVQGTQLDIAIPFKGDAWLWEVRPSTFSSSGYPEIEITGQEIVFSVSFPDDSVNSERLKSRIVSDVNQLADAVRHSRESVLTHNNSAPAAIRAALERKRQKAAAAVGAIADLGIPMRRRDQSPTFTVPTTRRRIPASPPKVSAEKDKQDPFLAEKEYQHILGILRSMSLVIERSPQALASLDEEAIRTLFLIQLNGHYEGSATGETFNAAGKTDILIRVENRNIFIAECKFWRGPKEFGEAIDQLLSYLSWRDSKCALLIFNKNRDSTAVRQKMHEIMESRPERRKTLSHDPNGDSRYALVKESDPGREIIITTQLFDIPTDKGKPG